MKGSEGGIYRLFEFIIEVIGWLRIAASPLLFGLTIGGIVYFYEPNTVNLIIGFFIAFAGLIVGILWANSKWKGKGTMWFMSSVMATKEEDENSGIVVSKKNGNRK